jgi:hypothetical protein
MHNVIINGMEMPVDCYSCDIRFGFACPAKEGKRIQQVYARPDWCPLRSVPEWVSVEERLPENSNPVLAWEEQGFCFVDNYINGKWRVGANNLARVTHWMPLPESPAGGDMDGR